MENGIIRELYRDFSGMIAEKSIIEIADTLSDWEIKSISDNGLVVRKEIDKNSYLVVLTKGIINNFVTITKN